MSERFLIKSTMYIDGRDAVPCFLHSNGGWSLEYPDAYLFTTRAAAERQLGKYLKMMIGSTPTFKRAAVVSEFD